MNQTISIYMKKYFGFVYLWYDTKYKKFLIGSHHGHIEDSYTTSTGGIHVRNIFKSRPHTMKRKILEFNELIDDKKYTISLEQKWLNKRPDIKNNKKYYNKTNLAGGGFDREIQIKRVKDGTHHFLGGKIQKRTQLNLVLQGKHNFQNHERMRRNAILRVENGTNPFVKSDFNKKAFILYCNDIKISEFASKVEAVNSGIPAHIIDKGRKYKKFIITTPSRKHTKMKFKLNDIIHYIPWSHD